MTNPFAQPAPAQPQQGNPYAQPAQQPQPGDNPYAQPQQQPPAQGGNPFGPGVPAAPPQQQAPATSYGTGPYAQTVPQQHAYAPAPQTAPPALDPSMLNSAPPPPPSADGKGAKLENIYGRLVLFFPLSRETKPKNPRFITDQDRATGNLMQDQVTATIVVLDDGQGGMSPVQWGGDPSRNQAHTDTAPLPYVRRGMWISQSKLIAQLAPYLPQTPGGTPGVVVGRPVRSGPEHNAPWHLQAATDQEIATARMYFDAVAAGQQPHPLA